MAEKPQNQFDIDDLKAPLLAAVGAADLALERVNEIVAALRERAGEARTDAETRVEDSRARITRLRFLRCLTLSRSSACRCCSISSSRSARSRLRRYPSFAAIAAPSSSSS